jgi:glycosyltransferase involved in cell wall biosynthesis
MPDFLVFTTLIPRLLGAKVMLQMYEPTPELWATRLGLNQKEDLERASWQQRVPFKILRRIEQVCIRYAHHVFAVTQQLKDNFVTHGANPDKITVVLNAPDSMLFEIKANETGLDCQKVSGNNRFTLICHGAIEERYGHANMLEAVSLLKSSIPNLQLRITGHGSYLDEFLSQVKAMGLRDHVLYLGFVPLAQLVKELRQADVGIVAQKSSIYSNLVHTGKMYDYMAFGKPVIASRLRALEAYFDDRSLSFFAPGDSSDLARAMSELYHNPEKREALAQRADYLYQQYCWEKQSEHYLAAYARLENQ